jgi:hypothetical protein
MKWVVRLVFTLCLGGGGSICCAAEDLRLVQQPSTSVPLNQPGNSSTGQLFAPGPHEHYVHYPPGACGVQPRLPRLQGAASIHNRYELLVVPNGGNHGRTEVFRFDAATGATCIYQHRSNGQPQWITVSEPPECVGGEPKSDAPAPSK